MKDTPLSRLITFAPIALMAICYVGCNSDDPPAPQSVAVNADKNEVTDHESLVTEFHTAEVVKLPYSSNDFIVRDTNGVIWYVNTAKPDKVGNRTGKTRIMAPFESRDWLPADYSGFKGYDPQEKAVAMVQALVQSAIQASMISNTLVTNFYNVTNYYDGPEAQLPPQMGGKITAMINKHISEFARTNRVWAEDPVKK